MLHVDALSGDVWLQLRHSVARFRPTTNDANSTIIFSSSEDAKGGKESVLCFAASPCGNFLAVATDAKVVRVLDLNKTDLLATVASVNCVKRAAFLLFDDAKTSSDATLLYIADKGGDVLSVAIATNSSSSSSGELVLGHLAMLTAIELVPASVANDIRCLATADADARIRISRLRMLTISNRSALATTLQS
ncbi:hypothetical protein BOX15_Mlig009081g1 [Macrostomum lignano]|uniref:Uncharacterized protein n=1 Tax=Macrostomum lignano TaxID=282301 RepID=A0A267DKM1_9PLAT|nr:hypothetical protein BOX15_Mlig009081g1 [Macrostomum lignano]